MLKIFFIFIILNLVSISLIGQNIVVKGYVLDENMKPLQFVNVVSLHHRNGTITDNLGYFSMQVDSNDSIKFSHLTTKSFTISVNDLIRTTTVILESETYQVKEIPILAKQSKTKVVNLGYFHQKNNGFFSLDNGNQLAVYIENSAKKISRILSISIKIKERGKCEGKIRIRLIDNKNNSPNCDILKDNIILDVKNINKNLIIDISKYNIFIPINGLFVVVEWLYSKNSFEKKEYFKIAANTRQKRNLVWLNYLDRRWEIVPNYVNTNGYFLTPNIGLCIR